MNLIARLEYELAYYDFAVHRFNHYTTRATPERESPWKDLSMYLLYSHPTTYLTDSYQRLTPTSLFGFQNSTAFIFKLSHLYIFSILTTYCIILSRFIICLENHNFRTPVDKPWFVYYPDSVFPDVILTYGVKFGHHQCSGLTFAWN